MKLTNQSSIRLILLIFPVSNHFVVPQGWSLTRELTAIVFTKISAFTKGVETRLFGKLLDIFQISSKDSFCRVMNSISAAADDHDDDDVSFWLKFEIIFTFSKS